MKIHVKPWMYAALAAICTVIVGAGAAAADENVLILVNPQAGSGSGVSVQVVNGADGGVDTMAIENELARGLMENGYTATLGSELMSGRDLSEKEVEKARTGNMQLLKKAAALHDAGVFCVAKVSSRMSTESVLGMEMTRADLTLSYRIYDTITGKNIARNVLKFSNADRSPGATLNALYAKMADGFAADVAGKVAKDVSSSRRKAMAKAKKSYRKKVVVAAKPKSRPKPAAAPSPAITENLKIVIVNPPLGRGFTIKEKRKTISLEGMVVDPSGAGVSHVMVNNTAANLASDGRFTYPLTLSAGANTIDILAVNRQGKTARKQITLNRALDTLPPVIRITQPVITRGFKTVVKPKASYLKVSGTVTDDSEILFVKINGSPVVLGSGGAFSTNLPLDSAARSEIRVASSDVHGNVSHKEIPITRGVAATSSPAPAYPSAAGFRPVLWGLSVGVSDYKSGMIDLEYADDDAKLIADFFSRKGKGIFHKVQFKTLLNTDVTRDSIIDAMTTHLGKAGPDDVVMIFVAGHGIKHRQTGSYYFVPSDADGDSLISRGLRMSDFEESIKILSQNVNKVIVAMDTCHSGAMQIGLRGAESESLAEKLKAASGLYILAASKSGESSMEGKDFRIDGDKGHGVFTYALINGMRGAANFDQDTYVSLNEVFHYVAKEVPVLTNGRQHPYQKVDGNDLPLVRLK